MYWNIGASFEVHTDFSVGLTASLATLDIQASSQGALFDPLEQILDPTNPRLPTSPDVDFFRNAIDDSDSDLAYTIGLHWHPDSVWLKTAKAGVSPLQFGAVLRKGAKFTFQEDRLKNGVLVSRTPVTLKVPDRYGIGVSYKPGKWLFTLDYERVEYSDLLEGFEGGVNLLTNEDLTEKVLSTGAERNPQYDVEDANIFRFGVERVFSLPRGSFSLRAGYFNSPDNKIAMTSFSSNDTENDVYLGAFGGGEDEDHFTAGFSYATARRHGLDFGADIYDGGTQFVMSYSFRLN